MTLEMSPSHSKFTEVSSFEDEFRNCKKIGLAGKNEVCSGYGGSRATYTPFIQSKILSTLKLSPFFYSISRIDTSRANLFRGGK